MEDFSPMIMFKRIRRSDDASSSDGWVGSMRALSVMTTSHSLLGGCYPIPNFGRMLSSVSWAPRFDYISVISQNIADAIDREILDDLILAVPPEERS